MRLSRVYARFYKSFNFDHVHKATPGAKSRGPWEDYEGTWYPYVEVDVEAGVTAIVGANESGKSHLLGAIEKAITGKGLTRRDVCRYSDVFGVERDRLHWPHVGVAWRDVTNDEAAAIAAITGADDGFTSFAMFREGPESLKLWIAGRGGWRLYDVEPAAAPALADTVLPRPFRIDPNIALPSSAPLAWLADPKGTAPAEASRRERAELLSRARDVARYLGDDHSSVVTNAQQLYALLKPLADLEVDEERERAPLALAGELLFNLAGIDPRRFRDLSDAIADGQDGYANAITESLNTQIERALNFRRWWVQDRDFSLRVSPREHELVFTIRDRTGTEYTFDERSSGLKYFLSYLIQSQANRASDSRPQILLMDEPDAHLSAEAQQDLLRIFSDLAERRGEGGTIQVVYVTHSPFLLDKNHADRIRVLEKGRNLDGTRVVKNISQNHYEPLRSAFGAFVGETAFVGSVNLLVEGAADQILLAGAARLIRAREPGLENRTLDLNRLVIVPCGSASQVPYMTYLIRGRDADKPPVLALLDSDDEGTQAAEVMRSDPKFKRHLGARYVVQLAELVAGESESSVPQELEDLIPLDVALAAANACLEEAYAYRAGEPPRLTPQDLAGEGTMFDRIDSASRQVGRRIDKIAFARAVVACALDAEGPEQGVSLWLERMGGLFERLNTLRRSAEELAARSRLSSLVDARVRIFLADRRASATREQVANLLEDIEAQLDESNEADEIRARIRELRRIHRLADDPAAQVQEFDKLVGDLKTLKDALAAARNGKTLPKVEAAPRAGSGETTLPSRVAQPKAARSRAAKRSIKAAQG